MMYIIYIYIYMIQEKRRRPLEGLWRGQFDQFVGVCRDVLSGVTSRRKCWSGHWNLAQRMLICWCFYCQPDLPWMNETHWFSMVLIYYHWIMCIGCYKWLKRSQQLRNMQVMLSLLSLLYSWGLSCLTCLLSPSDFFCGKAPWMPKEVPLATSKCLQFAPRNKRIDV